jgi:hypothetical protein
MASGWQRKNNPKPWQQMGNKREEQEREKEFYPLSFILSPFVPLILSLQQFLLE